MPEITDPNVLQQLNGGGILNARMPTPLASPPLREIVPPRPKTPPAQTPAQVRKDVADADKAERDLRKPITTPGQDAVDTEFAKDYVAYTAGGGFSDVKKQLGQLREVSERLKGENLTGPIIGVMPDFVNAAANPDAVSVRENVEEVVQRNLRMLLGAQFTQKEGDRLIARSYNPKLPEVENRKRVNRLRIQMTQAAMAKEDAIRYFEKNGTLRGWKGRLWNISDFNPEGEPSHQGRPRQQPRGGTGPASGWGKASVVGE